MNVTSRSKVAAGIAIMFLINFYYFKSWRKTPQSPQSHSSDSNNQMKLIKIVSPASRNNCSSVSQLNHAVYYVRDISSGMTSVFMQNARSSLQDISISIVNLNPEGLVNSGKILKTNATSSFSCEFQSNNSLKSKEYEETNRFYQEMETLVKKIKKDNWLPGKIGPDFINVHLRNDVLIIMSNCIQNIVKIFEKNDIETVEEELNCSEKHARNLRKILTFFMGSKIESNILDSKTSFDDTNLNEFYYGKINFTGKNIFQAKINQVKTSISLDKVNFKSPDDTEERPSFDIHKEIIVNHKIDIDKKQFNSNAVHMNVVNISIKNNNLKESKEHVGCQVAPATNTTSDSKIEQTMDRYSQVQNTVTETHKTEYIEKEHITLDNDPEKMTENNIQTADNLEENSTAKIANKTNEERQATDKRKNNREGNNKIIIGKNNGLNTNLVFQNVKEINEMYDRTFSDTDFIPPNPASHEVMEVSNRESQDSKINPVFNKYFSTNMRNSSLLIPKNTTNVRLLDTSKHSFSRTTKTLPSNDFLFMDDNYSKKLENTTKYMSNNSTNENFQSSPRTELSTEDMTASATENYHGMKRRPAKFTNTTNGAFTIKPKYFKEKIVVEQIQNTSMKNGHYYNYSEPINEEIKAIVRPSLNLFRSFSRDSDVNYEKPIKVIMKNITNTLNVKNNNSIAASLLLNSITHRTTSNTTGCCSTPNVRDSFDENTRNHESYFHRAVPESSSKSYTHSELSGRKKNVEELKIVQKTHDLYDGKPKYKTIIRTTNTKKSHTTNDRDSNSRGYENESDNLDNRILHKQGLQYAALVAPLHEAKQNYPNEYNAHNSNTSQNVVTYIPLNEEQNYDSGNIDTPQNIETYKPIILDHLNFNSHSSENHDSGTLGNNEGSKIFYQPTNEDNTTYYKPINEVTAQYFRPTNEDITPHYQSNDGDSTSFYDDYSQYAQETPSYIDQPQDITTQNSTNIYNEYTEYNENTEILRDEYNELSTPKAPIASENAIQPPSHSTEDISHENDGVVNQYNSDSRNQLQENNGNVPYSDYSTTEVIGNTGNNFYSGESGGIPNGDRIHHPNDGINQNYNVYIKPPQSSSLVPEFPYNIFDTTLSRPSSLDDLIYHKTVTPASYVSSQNYHAKINQFLKNKLPPDKNLPRPATAPNIGFKEQPNFFSGTSGQLPMNKYTTNNLDPTNKPTEHATDSPEETVNQFLNSPINFEDFDDASKFDSGLNTKGYDSSQQTYQSGYTLQENEHPSLNNAILNSMKNQSILNYDLNYSNISKFIGHSGIRGPLNKFQYISLIPNFVQSPSLGGQNSFQPLGNVLSTGAHSKVKDHQNYLENINTLPVSLIHSINFDSKFKNIRVPQSPQQIITKHECKDLKNNSINFRDAFELLKTHALRPDKQTTIWPNSRPQIEPNSQHSSQTKNSFQGIDIFLPDNKKFRKSIDIITPNGNIPILDVIKLIPNHKSSHVQQSNDKDKSFEIKIIGDRNFEMQNKDKNPHYDYTEEMRLHSAVTEPRDIIIEKKQNSPQTIPKTQISYLHGFQPLHNPFKPLDLSMDAGHTLATVNSIGRNTHSDPKNTYKQIFNQIIEKPEVDSSFSSVWAEPSQLFFDKFNTEHEINSYLKHISRVYGHKVNISTIGETVEGRPIQAVRISHGGDNKPMIVMDGGIHAREWIAPAVVMYVIHQLVENPEMFPMIRKVDWLLIPVLNPDGYAYSMTKDRMWRKNRARPKQSDSHQCYGVDLNRNFGVFRTRRHIDLESRGASDDPCTNNYRGRAPFSEPESRALRDVILKHKNRIKLYVSFHSFGNYFMYPWSYTKLTPNDWKDLEELASAARSAILNITGTRYNIGSTADIMGVNTGGSDDWVKGYVGVKYCYTVELPGGGAHGFDLPTSRIRSVVKDMFEGIKVFAKFIEREFG